MKSKSLIMLLFCLGFGALAAVAATAVLGNRGEAEVAVETRSVVLANDHLDIKSALNDQNCRVEQWPAKLVPEEAVSDLTMLEGKLNKFRLTKNMPITIEQVADRAFFEQDLIPPGHKVVAVKVNEDDTISGLLKPGQQVDIIGILDAPKDKNNRRQKVAKTFLKGIRVYSIDGERDGSAEKTGGRRGNSVVGVLVTEKQSEQIVLVQNAGDLKLVLRGEVYNGGEDEMESFETLFPGIIGKSEGADEFAINASKMRNEEKPDFQMEIWHGMESKVYNFDQEGKLFPNGGEGEKVETQPAGSSRRIGAEEDMSEFDDFEEDEYLGFE
jgi:pilus assembly protein CpaB